MANKTAGGWSSLPFYVGYLSEGALIGVANLLIVISICRFEALRTSKVHLIMLSLAFADFENMTAFAMAGAWRVYSVLSGLHDQLVSPWWCIRKPDGLMTFLSGLHAASLQLLVVSIDRLLATSFPLEYIGWSHKKYTYSLMAVSHGYTICSGLFGVALAYTKRHEATVKAYCSSVRTAIAASTEIPFYGVYFSTAPIVFSCVSVLVYVLVLLQYKRSTILNTDVERERRFTRTLAYSCAATFFLYVLPISTGQVLRWMDINLGTLFFVLSNLNPLMNLFIYQFHQPEMRMAFVGLFRCKDMPIDIKQWKANANADAARVAPAQEGAPGGLNNKNDNIPLESI